MDDKNAPTRASLLQCPLCYFNGKLEVIAHYPPDALMEEASAYLVLAKNSPNGNDYLVIPATHAETEDELPDDFTAACKYLRQFIVWIKWAVAERKDRTEAGYHTGTNYGASAGQTVWHVHQWYSLTPRGYHVSGIATYTHNDVRCQDELGMSLQELLNASATEVPDFAAP